ncbi:MAG TPA: hypothetical protein PKM20_08540 [Nitrosomonas sp.]|nr:hypothetical protein [Nitrosomonas sp.]HNP26774.1 hypothetical protein [Nitrosomonas sp.]
MKKLAHVFLLALICLLIMPVSFAVAEEFQDTSEDEFLDDEYEDEFQDHFHHRFPRPIVTAIDYHTRNIYLFNYKRDKVVIINPVTIEGWPGDVPLQHTMIMPRGNRLYVTTDNTADHPAYIAALKIKRINWGGGTAEMVVDRLLQVEAPGAPAELPFVEPVNDVQATPDWILRSSAQTHGPTILPHSNFIYFTEWTSDRVRVINRRTNEFAEVDPIIIPGYTEQTHGVMFNKSGTIGLGSGYFFDNSVIDRYKVNRRNGQLEAVSQIMLGTEEEHAAFSHYVFWLDDRYALTATMQLDKTSLTPSTTKAIIPPSVWMIDAWEGTATKIINHTDNADGAGVFRSATDIAVVGHKLYIAEEDSIDPTFADDGYISVFDISDRYNPIFIKRFKPGEELPQGFAVAHTLSPTPDGRYIMMASWVTGYVIKIDTMTDTVAKVFGPDDGLVMPHGLFAAGSIR